MHDSTGVDLFTFKPGFATLAGTHIDLRVDGFEHVTAIATSGTDTAKLYGSEENDLFIAHPDYAAMETGDVYGEAQGFDYQKGYAVEGGYDVAQLHDRLGRPISSTRRRRLPGYTIPMKTTRTITSIAPPRISIVSKRSSVSGSDVAVMKDSAGDDTFDRQARLRQSCTTTMARTSSTPKALSVSRHTATRAVKIPRIYTIRPATISSWRVPDSEN